MGTDEFTVGGNPAVKILIILILLVASYYGKRLPGGQLGSFADVT